MARTDTKSETRPEAKTDTEHNVYFSDVYEKLAAPFDSTFQDVRGGVQLEYITGEQAVSRLNEVLGVAGWSFRILEHGYNQEADEIWVLAELTANFGGATVVRQQFGSQKVKRSRTTDSPLDIGFDLKGATTDALKKCASLIGVGLYLSRKETPAEREAAAAAGSPATNGRSANGTAPSESYSCEQCGEELKDVRFRDGTVWTPSLLASYGRRKHGKVLCMQHYREFNEARKKAEVQVPSMDEVPF